MQLLVAATAAVAVTRLMSEPPTRVVDVWGLQDHVQRGICGTVLRLLHKRHRQRPRLLVAAGLGGGGSHCRGAGALTGSTPLLQLCGEAQGSTSSESGISIVLCSVPAHIS